MGAAASKSENFHSGRLKFTLNVYNQSNPILLKIVKIVIKKIKQKTLF